MEKESYKHNAEPRKIIFPLNERENWKGKSSVKHLGFSGKLRPLIPIYHTNPKPCASQAEQHFLHFRYLTKQLQSSVSVKKKLSFLVLCFNVFCSKLVTQLSGRFALMGLCGGFLLLNFCVVGSYWIFSSKIDAWKLDATF